MAITWDGLLSGGLGSLIVTLVTNKLMFDKQNKFVNKSKFKNLESLIKGTIDKTNLQIGYVNDLINKIEITPTLIPLLVDSISNPSKFLQDNVTSEDYFSAYHTLLKNVFNYEQEFFILKDAAILTNKRIEQIKSLCITAAQLDNDRRKLYAAQFFELKKSIYLLYPNYVPGTDQLFDSLSQIIIQFDTTLQNDGLGNIDTIQQNVVIPMENLLEHFFTDITTPLKLILGGLGNIYRDVIFQNTAIKNSLIEMNEKLALEIVKLNSSLQFISNNQVKSKWIL